MTRQSFEDGNKNNSIFLNLLESRFPVSKIFPHLYPKKNILLFETIANWYFLFLSTLLIHTNQCN